MIRVMIGYDPNETIAYHVLSQSIMEHSSQPVSITPLKLSNLPMFNRKREELQSTEFSFSRFLTPYLCDFKGHAIFIDCDMLVLADIAELWALRDDSPVKVVKHEYTPSTQTKFLGQTQSKYPMKNWSSVMLFNNEKCKKLTPRFVNTATGMELHQFQWTYRHSIGDLPPEWGHLVGEYEKVDNPKLIHWTLGGPYFKDYEDCDYDQEWIDMLNIMTRVTNPSDILK